VSVPRASVAADLAALVALTLLGALFLRTERTMQRWEGALLFASYGAYMAWRIAAGG
jgi:Ca2+/Na+ antiporter